MFGIELQVSRSRLVATGTSASEETRRCVGNSLEHCVVGEHVSLIARSTGTRVSYPSEASAEESMLVEESLETRQLLPLKSLTSWCADDSLVSGPLLPILPSLPFVFCRVGIIPGVVLIMVVGILAAAALTSREDESPHDTRMRPVLPFTPASLARFSFSIFHFGILVADQVLLRDIAASIFNFLYARNLLLALIFLLSAPFWLRAVKRTAASSITQYVESMRRAMAMVSTIFLCSILSLRAYQRSQLPHAHQHVQWVSAEGPSQLCIDVLLTFPIVLMCYAAALVPDSFPVRQERVVSSLHRHITLFCFVGISGYVFAGRETLDNVWLNFAPQDGLARCGKVVYCGFLWLFIPHTFRQGIRSTRTTSSVAVRSTMTAKACVRRQSYCSVGEVVETINCEADGSSSEQAERKLTQLRSTQLPPVETSAFAIAPLLLLFGSFMITVFVRHLAGIWGLVGSTMGILLCFIQVLPTFQFQLVVNEGSLRGSV
jgi:Transmembrane amino acid transporter protein